MKYSRALAARKRAQAACLAARGELQDAIDEMIGTYQAHPLPALAGAAGIGFVLAQLKVGSGLIRTGARIAAGPAWGLVREFFPARP